MTYLLAGLILALLGLALWAGLWLTRTKTHELWDETEDFARARKALAPKRF